MKNSFSLNSCLSSFQENKNVQVNSPTLQNIKLNEIGSITKPI